MVFWPAGGFPVLVLTHWCVEPGPWVSRCRALGCPRANAGTLVCGARSWALWWTRPGPGAPVGSGVLKAAALLVGGAVSLPG